MSRDYKLIRFKAWHLELLESRGLPVGGGYLSYDERLRAGLELAFTWTTTYKDEPIACGGLIEVFPGRYGSWAFLNKDASGHMRRITSHARWILSNVKGRVELSVRNDFELGHRWAKVLGFELETPLLRMYGPNGEDHTGYVRIT